MWGKSSRAMLAPAAFRASPGMIGLQTLWGEVKNAGAEDDALTYDLQAQFVRHTLHQPPAVASTLPTFANRLVGG